MTGWVRGGSADQGGVHQGGGDVGEGRDLVDDDTKPGAVVGGGGVHRREGRLEPLRGLLDEDVDERGEQLALAGVQRLPEMAKLKG